LKISDYESKVSIVNHEIIIEYLEFIEIEQYSIQSIAVYRRILFIFFSEFTNSIPDITFDDVSMWTKRYEIGRSVRTTNLALSVLSSFFKYCISEHYLNTFPIKMDWYHDIPDSMPKYLDKFEHAKVRISAQNLPNIRDKAMVELLDSSGMRVGELNGLDIKDINLKDRTAFVLGKGNKERLANFTEYCGFLLEQVIKKLPPGNGPLFVSQRKTRLSIGGIQDVVTKVGIAADIVRKLHPHLYRHTFATDLVNKGADLQVIADELGHEDINTSAIYARVLDPEVISVYRRCME
jgi:site-specific recombinase XerD